MNPPDDSCSSQHRRPKQALSMADFEWIFDAMPIPILLLGIDGSIVAVNDSYLRIVGRKRDELLGRKPDNALEELFPLAAACPPGAVSGSIARVIAAGRKDVLPLHLPRHTDGARGNRWGEDWQRYGRLIHAPLVDDGGELNYVAQYLDENRDWISRSVALVPGMDQAASMPDETPDAANGAERIDGHENRAAGSELATGPSLEQALENLPDILLVIDQRWCIDLVNGRAADALGLPRDNMIGQDLRYFVEAPVIDAVRQVMAQHQPGNCEHLVEARGRWWDLRMSPTPDGGVVILLADITERKLTDVRKLNAAQHDYLTGLANRRLFQEDADRALALAQRLGHRLAVLFIDLDEFKPINDTYGHYVGDWILKSVADRLNQLLRASDLVGRYGGDEFTAVMVSIENESDVAYVVENILATLNQPYVLGSLSLDISASIGVSLYPKDGDNVELLIRRADSAMYESKKSGRARFTFYQSDEAPTSAPAPNESMASRVRRAFDTGEFSLVFQPVFNTSTSEVVEAEALIRWRQADGSYVDPGVFLPAAEIAGLINPISEWLLNTACAQQQQWKSEGLPTISIAVKITGAQFRQKDFDLKVAEVLRQTGLDPTHLLLEMTEQTLLGNTEESVRMMKGLKDLGVNVAITNFGAGNSNVRALSRFPIDKLKMDRSFMQHAHDEHESARAADAIIGLGHSLHKEIVAQGIENEDDMAYVRSHGCQYSQGYLLAPPMQPTEFSCWWLQNANGSRGTRH